MKNKKEQRMETMRKAGLNTSKFFNLSVDVPIGSKIEIKIDGVPYVIDSANDKIIKDILEKGYVFNSKTDGRWITAQTFKLFNSRVYNQKTKEYEYGWDASVRLGYNYMYQFSMMFDEMHRLAKMEKSNDPEFERLSKFFTKEVVYETCNDYIRKLKKYVRNQKIRKCKGEPYIKLNKYGNIFIKDLYENVYNSLEDALVVINDSKNYKMIEFALKRFMSIQCKLPYNTPKSVVWKTAFKGKGAYLTLLNIIKFHNVTVQNYETGELLDRDRSIAYVESLLNVYNPNEYWKYHELLKKTITDNHFDLRDLEKNIEAQKATN